MHPCHLHLLIHAAAPIQPPFAKLQIFCAVPLTSLFRLGATADRCEGGSSLGKPQLNEGQGKVQLLLSAVSFASDQNLAQKGSRSGVFTISGAPQRTSGSSCITPEQLYPTLGGALAVRHANVVPESDCVDAWPTA